MSPWGKFTWHFSLQSEGKTDRTGYPCGSRHWTELARSHSQFHLPWSADGSLSSPNRSNSYAQDASKWIKLKCWKRLSELKSSYWRDSFLQDDIPCKQMRHSSALNIKMLYKLSKFECVNHNNYSLTLQIIAISREVKPCLIRALCKALTRMAYHKWSDLSPKLQILSTNKWPHWSKISMQQGGVCQR